MTLRTCRETFSLSEKKTKERPDSCAPEWEQGCNSTYSGSESRRVGSSQSAVGCLPASALKSCQIRANKDH